MNKSAEQCLRLTQWRGHLKGPSQQSEASVAKEEETDLAKHLKTKIRVGNRFNSGSKEVQIQMGGGPLSIAQFMRVSVERGACQCRFCAGGVDESQVWFLCKERCLWAAW